MPVSDIFFFFQGVILLPGFTERMSDLTVISGI